MHRCLQTFEILDIVLSHIRLPKSSAVNTFGERSITLYGPWTEPTFLSLALTCRAFQEPALAALWYQLPDFSALIKCMGRDLWVEEDNEIRTTREILPKDIEILNKYGCLVRGFEDIWLRPPLSREACLALHHALDERCLLPNLRWVEIWGIYHPPILELFIGSCIHTLNIRGSPHREVAPTRTNHASTLLKLAERLPNLTGIALPAPLNGAEYEVTSESICKWHHLVQLEAYHLSEKAIRHLANLSSLKHLDLTRALDVISSFYPSDVPVLDPSDPSPFPALESICLRCQTLEWPSAFMFFLRPSPLLKSVHLAGFDSLEPSSATDWEYAFSSVHRCCTKALTSLCIQEEYDSTTDEDIHMQQMPSDYLMQLQSFPNLIILDIRHPIGYNIGDDLILALSLSLPKLTKLRLTAQAPSIPPPRITLTSLISLDRACPNLSHVALSMDMGTLRLPEISVPSQSKLETLEVWHSALDSPQPVVDWFLNMFPAGMTISKAGFYSFRPSMAYDDIWNQVFGLLGSHGPGEWTILKGN